MILKRKILTEVEQCASLDEYKISRVHRQDTFKSRKKAGKFSSRRKKKKPEKWHPWVCQPLLEIASSFHWRSTYLSYGFLLCGASPPPPPSRFMLAISAMGGPPFPPALSLPPPRWTPRPPTMAPAASAWTWGCCGVGCCCCCICCCCWAAACRAAMPLARPRPTGGALGAAPAAPWGQDRIYDCLLLVGFLTSSSTTRLYRRRIPRLSSDKILRAATHKTERGDHDFCLSWSHYTEPEFVKKWPVTSWFRKKSSGC